MSTTASILDEPRLSMSAAAKRLGVALPTLWRYVSRGVCGRRPLRSIRIGQRRYILIRDLEAYVTVHDGTGSDQNQHESQRGEAAGRELDRLGI